MGKLAVRVLALAVVSGSWACGESDDRPKNVHVVSGGGGGGEGGSGSGGAPCTPVPGQGSTIEGNLITYDVYLKDILPFDGQAELSMAGATCKWITTTYDGSQTNPDGGPPLFTLDGAKGLSPSFVHIYQAPTSSEPVLPTLIAVEANYDQHIIDGFGMVRAQGIDEAYAATGLAKEDGKGTVLAQVVDKLGAPLAGAQIDMGINAAPAYPGVAGWQLGGETDASGVALMLNATAKPFPGQEVSINLTLGSAKESFKCPVEVGAVTICWMRPTTGF